MGVFSGCSGLTSVAIPNSVTIIDDDAFNGCIGLTSATMPDSVTRIGCEAFSECISLTSVIIPDSVTIIDDGAFQYCSGLTSVTIPNGVTRIGGYAFYGCSGLTSVTIPDSVTGIDSWAFSGCIGLTSVTIPDSVTSIGSYAFIGCSGLEYAMIPTTLDQSLDGVFASSTTIVLYNPVQEVTLDADGGVVSPAVVSCRYGAAYGELPNATRMGYTFDGWMTADGHLVTNETIVTALDDHDLVAQWVANEYQVTFDAAGGVVDGGDGAMGASRLTTYDSAYGELPTASCEGYVFLGWFLGDVEVNADTVVKTASDHTLTAKWGIQVGNGIWVATICDGPITLGAPLVPPTSEVVIPVTVAGRPVVGITAEAFAGNDAVTGVLVPAYTSITNIEAGALGDIPLTVIVDDDGQYIPDVIAENVRKVVFANGVTRIGDNYFECGAMRSSRPTGCPNLESVDIAESVVRIGTNVFEAASALETEVRNSLVICDGWVLGLDDTEVVPPNLVIPEGVRGIAAGAFEGEYEIETVEVPSPLRFIGAGAFRDCTGLEDISLPEGVVAVDREAFRNCTYAQGLSLPATLEEIGAGAFANCTSLGGVTVPDGVADIGECAFSNCWRMMSVAIPASVTNVGVGAFADCRRLAGVTVPLGIGTMAELFPAAYDKIASVAVADGGLAGHEILPMEVGMFAGCAAMESLTLSEGLGAISDEAFVGCESITAFNLPGSVTNIGARAFKDLAQLTSIAISAGVTGLGAEVFSGCTSLSAVALPKGLTVLPDGAFAGCASLAELVVPEDVSSIGTGVFDGCALLRSVRFVGDHAPSCSATAYSGTDAALVTYVARGSMGWDGIPTSKSLPESWPVGTAHEITWWEPNRFMVDFVADGGNGVVTAQVEQVTGTTYMLPPDATRRGAVFGGWWTATDGGARVTPVTQVALTRPHTFYAHWTFNRYAVIFDANGGEGDMGAAEMTVATSASLPPCGFSRSGYVFVGWATDPEGEVAYANEAEVVDLAYDQNAAVTLYAVWDEHVWSLEEALWGASGEVEAVIDHVTDWTVDFGTTVDGVASVRSGAIDAAESGERTTSTLEAAVTGPGSGSFWWKVSCEEMDEDYGEWYDYAVFTIDGAEVARIAGDSGWQQVEYAVMGEGVHTLAWTFTRDDYDEPDAEWENAAWVGGFVWTPVPKELTLADAIFDGESGIEPTTGGDSVWTLDTTAGETALAACAKSGAVASGESSWIEVALSGEGTLAFKWNVMGGAYRGNPFAYAMVEVDGVQQTQEYATGGWKDETLTLEGSGTHTVRWTYLRTSSRTVEGDCAWIDGLVWTSSGVEPTDPIPEIAVDATPEAVTNAIEAAGFADAESVKAAIGGSAAEYGKFKEWAGSVKGAGSASGDVAAGEAAVVANTNAAVAFLLGAERLFENAPTIEIDDFAVVTSAPLSSGGGLGTNPTEVTVSVMVRDGKDAVQCAAERVKEMFEATTDIGDWDGGRAGTHDPTGHALPVAVEIAEPVAGDSGETMRFNVTPGDGTSPKAFLRVRVK